MTKGGGVRRPVCIRTAVLSYVLHLDKHMHQLIASLGGWIYALLFTIVFAETGLVVRVSLAFHHTPTELP